MNIKKVICEFVISNFLFGDDSQLTEDTSFIGSGVIDSTGVLELITFIEETFGIKVEDNEIVPENLDSIRCVVSFVSRKVNQSEVAMCAGAR